MLHMNGASCLDSLFSLSKKNLVCILVAFLIQATCGSTTPEAVGAAQSTVTQRLSQAGDVVAQIYLQAFLPGTQTAHMVEVTGSEVMETVLNQDVEAAGRCFISLHSPH